MSTTATTRGFPLGRCARLPGEREGFADLAAHGMGLGEAHRADNLGYAGRRVLVSRKWSGKTLANKTNAEVCLTLKEAELLTADWINPDDGKISLAAYARTWIEERPGLRPKTVELYRYLLRKHLTPLLGPVAIADIQPSHVRRWRKHLLDSEVSAVTVAKAYRLSRRS
jgi:hypothetical protein